MNIRPRLVVAFTACVAWLAAPLTSAQPEANQRPGFERDRLPPALQDVPLERLSSGALFRLDRAGDLVEPHAEWEARVEQTAARSATAAQPENIAVALDLRVGPNIRLGDDPPALPITRRAQAEPHIARAPGDPDFLLATFQEGRFGNGGAVNCGYSVSRDGGLTWTRALIPGLGGNTGGPYERATDPVAGIDAAGNAYLNTLGLITRTTSQGVGAFEGSVLVSRSTDGGATFGPPVLAYRTPNVDTFADKNWMAINTFPGTASFGRILLTFTIFSNVGGVTHPIRRVYSDDQGATWSSVAPVHSTNRQVQGSQPVFLPDGRAVIIYWNFNNSNSFADDFLELVESFDGGQTFTAPQFITPVAFYDHPSIRDGAFLPSATADRAGAIHLVYQALHNGSPRIMFTKSSNLSQGWSTPIPITDNPAGTGVFTSAIAASPDGQRLTVLYSSTRDNPASNTLVNQYLAQSLDGGATWQPNMRLSSETTDATLAVNTGTTSNPNYMLGDYLGIAESTSPDVPAVPVWIDTRTGDPDPFVARVGIASEANFTAWQAARLSLGQIQNPALGGEAGDADGDGEDNLAEFRTGTDPNDPASVLHTGRLLNISTRAWISTGDNILIGGFIITGTEPKRVIARAIGPSLSSRFGDRALQDPTLELVVPGGSSVSNDNWQDSDPGAITETGVPPPDPREAAIVQTLAPGEYTAIVRSRDNTPGIGLVEVYDLTPEGAPRLANISSRGFVGVSDETMIAGVITGRGLGANGAGSVRAAVRGLGPSLTAQGVAGALQDPELSLHDRNGTLLAFNHDWSPADQTELQANGLVPQDPREAVIVATLPQGEYTAILRGAQATVGIGLVEVYELR
ncbi:hypothetical protein BH20VER1_BH20VER1_21360 [soil metagenome]